MTVRWISVKKALPKDGQEVLIGWTPPRKLSYTGDVHEAMFRIWPEDDLVLWDQGDMRWVVGKEKAPTHWAKMPSPPRRSGR